MAGVLSYIFTKKINTQMPEIFRFYGYSFFFYSREHEPLHVHVEGAEGRAKYELVGGDFMLKEAYNIKRNDLKRIKEVIDENKDIIIRHWHNYFGKEAEDD